MFVDRRRELSWLAEKWSSGRAELLLVYGRRRVGKTRLLLEWSSRALGRVFYFLAEEEPESVQLERLSRSLAEFSGDELLAERPFTSWRQVFLYLSRLAENERIGFILDEFQYAVGSSPGLPSTLQALWDTRLKYTRVFIVLMGSIVSFSEGILGQQSPLYARFTGVLRLRPLSPLEVACFAKNWSPEDWLRLYSVFGGVPGYLAEIDSDRDLWWNIERLVLRPNARFLDEAKYLLKEELREVSRYYAILEAIASGATSYGEIVSRSGVSGESLSKYLRVLEDMGLIGRERPLVGRGKSRYTIVDPFLRFWFRYIPRYRSAIELGFTSSVLNSIRQDLEQSLVPQTWEEAVKHIIAILAERGGLPLTPTRIGRWWHRGVEIDLLVVDDTQKPPLLLAVESKWSKLDCNELRRELNRLRAKAEAVPIDARREYLIAVRDLDCSNPRLLGDERVVTLSTYRELALKQC